MGRASAFGTETSSFCAADEKIPNCKSLHTSGPAREIIICFALILQHVNTKHDLRRGRALFLSPTGCLSRSAWEMGAPGSQVHPPTFLSQQAMGTGWALERELFLSLSRGSHASWSPWWVSQSVFLYSCSPACVSSAGSHASPHVPGPSPFHHWSRFCVSAGSIAATEAYQRNFLSARAEKVHDGFSCPHFQLCLKVQAPKAIMSAASARSTGVEKDLNYTGRVCGWVTQRNCTRIIRSVSRTRYELHPP